MGPAGSRGAQVDGLIVELAALAAVADGELSAQERGGASAKLTSVGIAVTPEQLEAAFRSAQTTTEGGDRQARIASIAAALGDPATRATAFRLLVRVTASDGLLRTSEREIIMEAAHALEIAGDEAARVVREVSQANAAGDPGSG